MVEVAQPAVWVLTAGQRPAEPGANGRIVLDGPLLFHPYSPRHLGGPLRREGASQSRDGGLLSKRQVVHG